MRRWARGGRTPTSSSAPATAPSAQLHRADRTRGEDSERSGHCNAERGGRRREGRGRTDAEGEGGGGGARRRRGQDEGEEHGAAGGEARRRRRRRLRVRGPPEGRGRRRTAAERWPRRRWTRWRGERVDGAHWDAHCEGYSGRVGLQTSRPTPSHTLHACIPYVTCSRKYVFGELSR